MSTVNRRQELETLAVLALFLLVLAWKMRQPVLAGVALVLVLAGLLYRPFANRTARCWFALAELLGQINAKILLTVLFLMVLTPVALLYRLFSNNPLLVRREQGRETYFTAREYTFSAKDLEKMW